MIGLWNVNWLNQNSQRSYPLSDAGDKCSSLSPDVRIPDDFLLALRLSVHTGHDVRPEKFFLKSLVVSPAGCTVTFGYDDGTEFGQDAAVCSLSASEEIQNCRLSGVGNFEDAVGYAAFNGQCPLLRSLSGYYSFYPASSYVEPDCVVPMLRGVSSVRVSDGTSVSERYYGDIEIVEGSNVQILTEPTSDGARIIINALDTTGFSTLDDKDCVCDLNKEDIPITSIGGAYPGADGSVNFVGSGCLAITGSGNTLTFSDTCAEPDCGCTELESLAASIKEMEDGIAGLNRFLESLYEVLLSTNAAVTSSNKGGGCSTTLTDPASLPEIIPY